MTMGPSYKSIALVDVGRCTARSSVFTLAVRECSVALGIRFQPIKHVMIRYSKWQSHTADVLQLPLHYAYPFDSTRIQELV